MAAARAHFHLAGTPVRVEPAFWLIVVLFGFGVREGWSLALWVAVVFVSILLHELGHAIAYRIFGQRASIVLHGFAGLTFGQRRLPRWPSIAVSLAGPLSALLLLGVPARFLIEGSFGRDLLIDVITGRTWEGWYIALDDVVFVNVYWSLVNLLPIRPLDGGNVMTELVGIRSARVVSVVVAGLAAAYAFTTDYRFAAFFAILLGFMNFSELRNSEKGSAGRSVFQVDAPPPAGSNRRREQPVSPSAGSPAPRDTSATGPPTVAGSPADLELQAWNALRNGQTPLLRRIVMAGGAQLSDFLRGSAALVGGDTARGVELLAEGFSSAEPPNLVAASTVAVTGAELDLASALARRPGGPAGMATLQTHLHYGGHHRSAALVGEALHAAGAPSPAQTAFETACAWAREGDIDRAFRWLDQAASDGFRAPELLAGEPDLASLRSDARWAEIEARTDSHRDSP